ncbi:kelch motif family protein [Stylonychia lemnae]|uniref:Kelch motif family protein n=1 Tax=Stylonychia lemnae TaxID=5949 RepID=A0A078AKV6_STYLE|nr:kelch motif family protein [Stylonychia lemnae]|eukprot:CDW83005.1 kelch motif family protein [Stylonychia lemnae]
MRKEWQIKENRTNQATIEFPFDVEDPKLMHKAIFSSPQNSLLKIKATQENIQTKLSKFEDSFAQRFQDQIVKIGKKKILDSVESNEKNEQSNLQKIDVSEYFDAVRSAKKEKDKEVIQENKELQIKLQKQLSQFKNLKDVNDKLFYTPALNLSSIKSPVVNIDSINDRIKPLSNNLSNNDYKTNSMGHLNSMNSTIIIQDYRQQQQANDGSTRNKSRSPDRPNPMRHQLLLRRYNIRKAEEQNNIMSGSRRDSIENQQQTLKCLNEQNKLSYNKDAFLRFYKLKQSLQSQNILFNQLQEQQKISNNGSNLSNVENNPDFFVTAKTYFHQQNIRHISIGFAISAINDNIYLIGGKISSFTRKGISKAFYDSGLQNLRFEEILDPQQDQSALFNDIFNRYGHHMHTFDDQLVIVGGESGAINNNSVRAVIGDIAFLNVKNMRRQVINFRRPLFKLRAFASCILGKYLYQFGGIIESGEVSNKLIRINLTQDKNELFKWSDVDLQIDQKSLKSIPARSYASIEPVYYEQKIKKYKGRNQDFNLRSLTQEIDWKLASSYIEEEGMYIFGGLDDQTQPSNDLFIIQIDQYKIHQIKKLITFGKIPAKRFMHSMNLFQQSNVLIITGGRNDNLPQNNILGDMHVLYLDSLTWIEVSFCSAKIIPRFQFQSVIIDTKLIIIGGMNSSYKIMHDYEVIELDQETNFQNHASKYLFKKMGSFLRANLAKKKSMEFNNPLQQSTLDLQIEQHQVNKETPSVIKQMRSKEQILQDLLKLNLSKAYISPTSGTQINSTKSSHSNTRYLNKSSINIEQDYRDNNLSINLPQPKEFIFRGKRRSIN